MSTNARSDESSRSTIKEPLWRHMVGAEFRRLRHERGETLDDVAKRAGVSSQYLSEMERGVKDPSSEMIAAVARALGISLLDLTRAIFSSLVNDDGVSNANERHVTACATGRHSSHRLLALDSRHVVAVVPASVPINQINPIASPGNSAARPRIQLVA